MTWTKRLGSDSKPAAQSTVVDKTETPQPHTTETVAAAPADDSFEEMKSRIHKKLLDALDLSKLDSTGREDLRSQVGLAVDDLLTLEGAVLRRVERDRLIEQILDEILGLGPLEPLLRDDSISDILVNGAKQTYVERKGKLEPATVVFKDDAHLLHIIDRIVSRVGRRVDESSPMVDARLADGSRVNAIIPPLAIDGPALSIRKFGKKGLGIEGLIKFGALTPAMAEFLRGAVIARMNCIVSGGTGAGKTTLLNVLSGFIPSDERIVTIEDSAELQLMQEHVVRLETRPPNVEGHGEVTQRDLVRNCLRMRPDRIIVGEVRAGEALDMLQAMNTGHDGSIATLHANTPRDALARLETMIAMAGVDLPDKAMRQQISSAVNIIIQASRLSDGSRKVIAISEVLGMEGETIVMQDIFLFERLGVNADGKVIGHLTATGIRPKACERIQSAGIHLPPEIFEKHTDMER
ncbi:MAG TPA: CpaF family protein [Planctomycetota bacterium]|nr:CpaF family protein [Planctomycetota bacterium]